MISNVALDCKAAELALIEQIFHDEAANLSEEQWQMEFFRSPEAFLLFLKQCPLGDMACIDIYSDEALGLLAVSYTHLDVYKRQAAICRLCAA